MNVLNTTTWHVLVRWEDGHRSRLVYRGPMWIGKASQDVHMLAQAEHRQRRERTPGLPARLAYQVLSFREEGLTEPAAPFPTRG